MDSLCNNIAMYVGGDEKLIVTLSQFDGKVISNGIIHIGLNHKNYTLITDAEVKFHLI